MKLFMSEASPFVRKVRLAAAERGLFHQLEPVIVNPHDRGAELLAVNPLSKIPTLVADDGSIHCDSFAICLYLDTIGAAPPVFPLQPSVDIGILQRHVLANGIADIAVARRVEVLRPAEAARAEAMERHRQTIIRALDRCEATVSAFCEGPMLDAITLAAALSYLDFRFPEDNWRDGRPRLMEWFSGYENRPAMEMTHYPT